VTFRKTNKIFQYYIMTRKLSDWNIFVKKIYAEGKAKNSNYEFKQALVDASKRKSEMKHHASTNSVNKSKSAKKNRKSRSRTKHASMAMAGGRKSRKRHHRRH
jgi:hypothetical protein